MVADVVGPRRVRNSSLRVDGSPARSCRSLSWGLRPPSPRSSSRSSTKSSSETIWERPGPSPRDRSLVTVSVLAAVTAISRLKKVAEERATA